jgi:hypothetical protein
VTSQLESRGLSDLGRHAGVSIHRPPIDDYLPTRSDSTGRSHASIRQAAFSISGSDTSTCAAASPSGT